MKNKIEFKKVLIYITFTVLLFMILFGIIQTYQYKTYTKNFNERLTSIIIKLNEEYPELNKNDIVQILNSSNVENGNVLGEYGINLEKDSLILENDNKFKTYLKLNLAIILLLGIFIFLIFLKYNFSKDKKLKEITKYIEEINHKNYKLDIESNKEDELSILKNEIYKTTIMLKEFAENSLQDKIKLKESLEDISHQLKTPLTSIMIMLDNILETPNMSEETRTEFIKDIKREVLNINFLVQTLLKLSKFDANSIEFINSEVYVKELLEASMKNLSALCDLKNIKVNICGDSNIKVICDVKWQVEALTNIIKNSIEHSAPNSNIDIKYEQNKMYTKIEIQDYGKGIAKEDLPHIFERFYKGKNSSENSIGIGLALSKSIIERDNGYIICTSKEGEGTTFEIKYMK